MEKIINKDSDKKYSHQQKLIRKGEQNTIKHFRTGNNDGKKLKFLEWITPSLKSHLGMLTKP